MLLTATRPSAASIALLERVLGAEPLGREEALRLYCDPQIPLEQLAEAARELRRKGKGSTITFSTKVFLPLTNLCRDRCGYCTFRRDPGQAGAHWMEPAEVLEIARAGAKLGCHEALLSLGDRPEAVFPEAHQWLTARGFARTLDYVAAISERLLEETALLPHSTLVAIPGTGHSVLGADLTGCSDRALKQFFQNKKITTSCRRKHGRIRPDGPIPG